MPKQLSNVETYQTFRQGDKNLRTLHNSEKKKFVLLVIFHFKKLFK